MANGGLATQPVHKHTHSVDISLQFIQAYSQSPAWEVTEPVPPVRLIFKFGIYHPWPNRSSSGSQCRYNTANYLSEVTIIKHYWSLKSVTRLRSDRDSSAFIQNQDLPSLSQLLEPAAHHSPEKGQSLLSRFQNRVCHPWDILILRSEKDCSPVHLAIRSWTWKRMEGLIITQFGLRIWCLTPPTTWGLTCLKSYL